MTLRGLAEVQAELARRLQEIEGVTQKGIKEAVLDLWGKSVELAPVDTGDLRGSGKAEFDVSGGKISGAVSFSTPYAVKQHEELEYNHPNGGQAKYLQQPFEENIERYLQNIINDIRRAL